MKKQNQFKHSAGLQKSGIGDSLEKQGAHEGMGN